MSFKTDIRKAVNAKYPKYCAVKVWGVDKTGPDFMGNITLNIEVTIRKRQKKSKRNY